MISPEELVEAVILKHGETPYDPVKAREYYLRTRELKGRRRTTGPDLDGEPTKGVIKPQASPKNSAVAQKALQAKKTREIQAKVAELEKRLGSLKELLKQLVSQSKERAGTNATAKKDPKAKAGPAGSKASGGSTSAAERKLLTAQQKAEARKRSKEYYDKNKPPAEQVKELETKIKAVRAKIAKVQSELAAIKAKKRG